MALPPESTVVTLANGLVMVLPRSMRCTSTFIAAEQGGWFEDELSFLVTCCQPGWNIVDIGASFGFYSMALARAAQRGGAAGRCCSFEPHGETAARLRCAAQLNGVSLRVMQCAVADSPRKEPFAVGSTPELSQLAGAEGGTETPGCVMVDVVSLDGVAAEGTVPEEVHILKMDCEGSEERVLRGAGAFLQSRSPLVLWEVSHAGHGFSLHLIPAFAAHGYRPYRLVPGLGLLRPYPAAEEDHSFMLNLFAAKDCTAATLAQRGLLCSAEAPAPGPAAAADTGRWQDLLGGWVYCGGLLPHWVDGPCAEAVRVYARARRDGQNGAERHGLLRHALSLFEALAAASPGDSFRLCSVARCQMDLGQRGAAGQTLRRALSLGCSGSGDREPFLAPSRAAENVLCAAAQQLPVWYEGAMLHTIATASTWSLSFSGGAQGESAAMLRRCVALGHFAPDSARRLGAAHALEQEITAPPPAPAQAAELAAERARAVPRWEEAIDLGAWGTTPGPLRLPPGACGLPGSLRGRRVLVAGVRDGLWAFEAARRGAAEVVGVRWPPPAAPWPPQGAPAGEWAGRWAGFAAARDVLGLSAERCRGADVPSAYEITAGLAAQGVALGFDEVWCFGWLRSERHPLLLLDALRRATGPGGRLRADAPCSAAPAAPGSGPACSFELSSEGWLPTPAAAERALALAGFEQVAVASQAPPGATLLAGCAPPVPPAPAAAGAEAGLPR
eukprot:TRINITY_DN32928_c0_g1_i1.p1 TRINITY_DN32928_c0_g1~~TRINITY_DN32928_c0_g1_i1.p1  ORF type:complete len:758 (+),score=232.15 TRINITY_DN32928_c0_g1_i1:88-2274(+)